MNAPATWPRILVIVGLAGMLVGAVDPLEGSLIILPSTGLVAVGSLLGNSQRRALPYWSFALVAIGIAAMFVLSWLGGIGGNTGRSIWWSVVILPYPVGWLTGVGGAVLLLIESFKRDAPPNHSRQ